MTKGTWVCLLALLVPGLGLAADTQSAATKPVEPTEISLEDLVKMEVPVVEAASKYTQKITEAPSSVTIITSDEVKKYGHRTLADILQTVPGMYVTYDRNYAFLGVRGVNMGDNNNRVLLLVDGHRLNNSLSDSAYIGTEFILDVDLIDRVEIIRGPGSSLYGNNAFFGVINVITRKGRDMPGNGVELSGELGSFDTYKARATYGKQFKSGLELLFSGTYYDSEGQDQLFYKQFNAPADNNGVAVDADNDTYKSAFASLGFKDFTLEGAYINREKRNPTAQFLTDFNDNRLRTTDDRGYVNFKYAHEFPDVVDVTARVYYDHHSLDIDEPYSGVLYRDAQKADWWGAELQFTKRLWDRHTFTLGGEYRDDFLQQERYFDVTNGTVYKDLNRTRQNHGIYFQGDIAVVTNLHVNGGVRYDQYGDFGPTFNPRVAVIYNPIGQTVFKGIYGTAFRAPNFFELSDPRNQNLQPETIRTIEGVYEQGIGSHLRSSIDGFYNRIDDLITFNSDPGHQRFENMSKVNAEGVEVALDGFWASGIRGRASYTFAHTENTDTAQVLTDSPAHLGKLNISVPVWSDKVFAGVEFLFVSERTTTHLTPQGTSVAGADAPGYGLVNLTLFSQHLVKGLELSASIYNLLNKHYGDPSTPFHQQDIIDQDGRSFRVKLTYRF
jgi:iron complex outermembrane receptor protein